MCVEFDAVLDELTGMTVRAWPFAHAVVHDDGLAADLIQQYVAYGRLKYIEGGTKCDARYEVMKRDAWPRLPRRG